LAETEKSVFDDTLQGAVMRSVLMEHPLDNDAEIAIENAAKAAYLARPELAL
jgi:hypothetical protein